MVSDTCHLHGWLILSHVSNGVIKEIKSNEEINEKKNDEWEQTKDKFGGIRTRKKKKKRKGRKKTNKKKEKKRNKEKMG